MNKLKTWVGFYWNLLWVHFYGLTNLKEMENVIDVEYMDTLQETLLNCILLKKNHVTN